MQNRFTPRPGLESERKGQIPTETGPQNSKGCSDVDDDDKLSRPIAHYHKDAKKMYLHGLWCQQTLPFLHVLTIYVFIKLINMYSTLLGTK